ncbi:hypothetical protein Pan216_49730 [Planctomycetes bacterium Pan216]|uniref:Uncharacterized protein n=1 Tax=Kolteria novifilia TaxID=2527975 RepID=A0A518BAS2_9BACT|nr:hypothetical protein Pan216_49730 [Planctomycetes bacterium Pan216]
MNKWILAAGAALVIGVISTAVMVLQRSASKETANVTEEANPREKFAPSANLPTTEEGFGGPQTIRSSSVPTPPTKQEINRGRPEPLSLRFAQDVAKEPTAPTPIRRRGGTELPPTIGQIQARGGRTEFVPDDGSGALILLENELLERVEYVQARESKRHAELRWKVRGLITEYRKTNYLLLRHAVLAEAM